MRSQSREHAKPLGDTPEYIQDIYANTSAKRFIGTYFLLIAYTLTLCSTIAAVCIVMRNSGFSPN